MLLLNLLKLIEKTVHQQLLEFLEKIVNLPYERQPHKMVEHTQNSFADELFECV